MKWPVVSLNDETVLITKGTTPTTLGYDFADEGVPFLRAQNLVNGTVSVEADPLYISQDTHNVLSRSKIHASDVLISIAGTIGRAAIVPDGAKDMNCNQAVAIVRPSHNIYCRFLLHWLSSTDALSQVSRGKVTGTISNLSLGQIGKLEIPLPPLDEQRRIAAILDKADSLRQKRKQAIALLDDLVEAAFIEMFGGSEAEAWPISAVSDLASNIRTGPFGSQLLHSEFVDEGVAVLGIDNAVSNHFEWRKARYITEEKYQALKRYTVHPGDVLITIMGTCGRCAIVPDDVPQAINTKHLCCITLKTEVVLPEYLHAAFLMHPAVLRQLGIQAKGAVMPGLNMGIIKSLVLPVPPIGLQKRFASFVQRQSDAMINATNDAARLDILFASLQHRAFTGEL